MNTVTLNEAGRRLGVDPRYAKGAAEGMGIRLVASGPSLVMSEADFERLKGHLSSLARSFRTSRAG